MNVTVSSPVRATISHAANCHPTCPFVMAPRLAATLHNYGDSRRSAADPHHHKQLNPPAEVSLRLACLEPLMPTIEYQDRRRTQPPHAAFCDPGYESGMIRGISTGRPIRRKMFVQPVRRCWCGQKCQCRRNGQTQFEHDADDWLFVSDRAVGHRLEMKRLSCSSDRQPTTINWSLSIEPTGKRYEVALSRFLRFLCRRAIANRLPSRHGLICRRVQVASGHPALPCHAARHASA